MDLGNNLAGQQMI